MTKVMRLEMTFPAKNDTLECIHNTCCNWGKRKIPHDADGNIRGK